MNRIDAPEFSMIRGPYAEQVAQVDGRGQKILSISDLLTHALVVKHEDVPSEVSDMYQNRKFESSEGVALHPNGGVKLVNFYDLPPPIVANIVGKPVIGIGDHYDNLEGQEFAFNDVFINQVLPFSEISKNPIWNELVKDPLMEHLIEYVSKRYDDSAMGIYQWIKKPSRPIWLPWSLAGDQSFYCIGIGDDMHEAGLVLGAGESTLNRLRQTFDQMYNRE